MQSWSVIILNFEEKDTIKSVVDDVVTLFAELSVSQYEILIVDDCSQDGSVDVISEIEHNIPEVRTIINKSNLGIGSATKLAHRESKYENVYLISADGEANVQELKKIDVNNILEDEFYLFERIQNYNYGIYRHTLSFINRLLNFLLFGNWIYDVHWNKVIKKKHLNLLDLQLKSGLVDGEIVFKLLKRKLKLRRIASSSNPRSAGKAQGGSVSSVFNSLNELVKLWRIVRAF